MRVVLDTNVVVSAAFFGGPPRAVLDAWADGRLHLFVSPSIFDEYLRVCDRLADLYPEADYHAVLTELVAHGSLVPDSDEVGQVTADPDDDKFMRCALAASAVVVSGDRHLLDASGWQDVPVLMVVDQRETQGARLARQVGIEVFSTKRLPGLAQSRFEHPEVPQAVGPTGLFDDEPVQPQYLSEAEIPNQRSRS